MTAVARVLAAMFVHAAAALSIAAYAQNVVPPLPVNGSHAVACTNVEQDFSRVPNGDTAEMYWRGLSGGGKERYVDALLVSPASALTSTVTAPGDEDLFDRWAVSRSGMCSSRVTRRRRRMPAPITRCRAAT
jgi:hypothetical protein